MGPEAKCRSGQAACPPIEELGQQNARLVAYNSQLAIICPGKTNCCMASYVYMLQP